MLFRKYQFNAISSEKCCLISEFFSCKLTMTSGQAPVVWKVNNAIQRINNYPVDSVICFVTTYPAIEEPGPGACFSELPVIQLPGARFSKDPAS